MKSGIENEIKNTSTLKIDEEDEDDEEPNILIELGLIQPQKRVKVKWEINKIQGGSQHSFAEDKSSEGFKSFSKRFISGSRLFKDFANIALKKSGAMIPLDEKDDDFFDLQEE